jgi:predicted O-linked N-acetylglucosamine transferase (SPINDLY family)
MQHMQDECRLIEMPRNRQFAAAALANGASSPTAHYAALAIRLTQTPAELSAFAAHLETGRRTFPLFDTAVYCRNLEAAYEECWARHLMSRGTSRAN